MSNGSPSKGTDVKALLQELKTNRRTQGMLVAFANIYAGAGEAISARKENRILAPLEGDFPKLIDGARGVRFIEKAVESAHSNVKWTTY